MESTAQSDTGEATTDEPATAESGTSMDSSTATDDTAPADSTTTAATTDAQGSGERYVAQQAEGELLANDVVGANVENSEGDSLGTINDVIITEDQGIKAVVIGVGGFLGIGEKNVAVSYDDIEQTTDENGDVKLMLNATNEELENAPRFVSLEEQEEASRQQAEMDQTQSTTGTTGTGTMGTTGTGTTGTANQ